RLPDPTPAEKTTAPAEKTTQETEKSQTSNWSTRPYLPEARIPAGSPPPAPRTAEGLAGTADSATATATTVSSPPRSQVTSLSRPYPPGRITPAGSPPTAPRTAGGLAGTADSATATPKTALSQRRSLPPRKLAAPPPRPRVAQANFERCSCCSHGRLRL